MNWWNPISQRSISYNFFTKISNRAEVVMIGGWCAVLLQLYHPLIAAGIRDHSQFQSEPFKRVFRTMLFLEIILNGSSQEKDEIISWLKRIHIPVKGTLQTEGSVANLSPEIPYGFTEELQIWVLATLVFAFLQFHEVLGTKLNKDEKDLICNEFMMIAHRLGVPRERLPQTYAEYEQYFIQTINELKVSPTTMAQVAQVLALPGMGSNKVFRLIVNGAALLGFSLLPEQIRKNLKIQFSVSQRLLQVVFSLLIRVFYRLFPAITIHRFLLWLCQIDPSLNPLLKGTLNQIQQKNLSSQQSLTWFSGRNQQPQIVHPASLEKGIKIYVKERIEIVWLTAFQPLQKWIDERRCKYLRYWLAKQADNSRPQHLGIIMDGNRRFAKQQQLVSWRGHYFGANKLRDVVIWAFTSDVKVLTVWAFSKENFRRQDEEINNLFHLMEQEFRALKYSALVHTWRIRVRVIGERDYLPISLQEVIDNIEKETAQYNQFFLQVAMPYGGRAEIVSAVRTYLSSIPVDELPTQIASLQEEAISRHTYFAQLGLPPIDYILRTSNEWRTSGFMLWDSGYSELFFCEELWPDFSEVAFLKSLQSFYLRQRRFGA
ncbi:polyprenyl diphosphate synthase [Scytonema sp. PRP1]|uniref:polyprenyl diphosphate synthase n=1 Tax=Scytonema sp. PRP1 TaxID=3120513 RepID=UPI002FD2C45D